LKLGIAIAANRPATTITTISSRSVNPFLFFNMFSFPFLSFEELSSLDLSNNHLVL
jgi:hypothetical protein